MEGGGELSPQRVDLEVLFDSSSPSTTHLEAKLWALGESIERVRKSSRIALVPQPARLPVNDGLWNSGVTGRNDWQAIAMASKIVVGMPSAWPSESVLLG